MKKPFFYLLMLIAGTLAGQAQSAFHPEVAIGANAVSDWSSVGFTPRVPQTLLHQYGGGLTLRYISEKTFGLQVELNYAMRGWNQEVDTVVHFDRYARSLAYLELPVLTHIYFDLGKHARLIFNLGPQIAYQLREKELERDIISDDTYYDLPVQHRFDYGIAGGGGLEIRSGIGNFLMEGRYYYGLSDIFNSSRGNHFQASHNQVISLRISYLIDLLKH